MSSTNGAMPDRVRMETGLLFLAAVKRFVEEDDLRGAIATVGEPGSAPRRSRKTGGRRTAIPVIGAGTIARALLASSLSSAEAALGLDAMADGGGRGADIPPEIRTAVSPDFVRLAQAALEAYDAESQSFDLDGFVVHAVRPR